jgi:hypothetical protein
LKRIALLAVVGAGLVALPGTAAGNTDCTYASGPGLTNIGGTAIDVAVQAGPGGLSGTSENAVGACVDGLSSAPVNSPTDGGAVEAGYGLGKGNTAAAPVPAVSGLPGVYGVVDGDDNSTDPSPSSQLGGYGAISNYESSPPADRSCDATEGGTGTNSGGCFFVKPAGVGVPLPLLACGNTSGKAWNNAGRDGCSIP